MGLTKRQKEILDFIDWFMDRMGYAPSLEEIGAHFRLSSVATVHKHLVNLQEKGLIRRDPSRSRSIELIEPEPIVPAVSAPLYGYVAAGQPIEAIANPETIALPPDLVGRKRVYVLQVKGDSMIEEHIQDGDYVIVEERKHAEAGEMVVALLRGEEATLKRFYQEDGMVRLQSANPAMEPIRVPADEVKLQGVVVGVVRKYR